MQNPLASKEAANKAKDMEENEKFWSPQKAGLSPWTKLSDKQGSAHS